MALLHALSYGSAIFAFCFIVLSLASGLLWISELIEENSRTAKTVGKRGIYAIILLHLVLYRTDSLPLAQTLFSIFCHVVYLQNFSPAWPAISLASPSFVASCVLVIADHFIWFFEFARRTQEARHTAHRAYGRPQTIHAPAFADIATFFGICVWLAPLFLFLSLSANDNALPVQSGAKTSSSSESPSPVPLQTKQHSSLFRSLLRPKRATTDEGILSPRLAFSPSNGPLRVPSLNNLPRAAQRAP